MKKKPEAPALDSRHPALSEARPPIRAEDLYLVSWLVIEGKAV